MKTILLTLMSSIMAAAVSHAKPLVPNREGAATCALQIVYSDPDLMDGRPRSGDGTVVLRPEGPLRWQGQIEYDIAALRAGGPSYKVELQLVAERNRSTWVDETPRLTVTTRLLSGTDLLAINEATSDQLLTPTMLTWMRNQEQARVVSKMLNPQLINNLEKIDHPEVRAALPDYFRAMKLANLRQLLPRDQISRIDTVCTIAL